MNNSEAYTVNVDRGDSPRRCCMCFSLAKADEEFVSAAKEERNISGELIDVIRTALYGKPKGDEE